MMWAFVVVGAVIVLVWIGINVSLLRRYLNAEKAGDGAARSAEFSMHQEVREVPQEAPGATASASVHTVAATSEPAVQSTEANGTSEAAHAAEDGAAMEVEVAPAAQRQRKVFGGSRYPFVWHRCRVEVLADDRWATLFEQLTHSPEVLGWVAFEGDTVGAADREYDDALLEVLREHRCSVARLQQEVGLSRTREWLLIGEEGTVGVLHGPGGVWLAVFVDGDADVSELGKRLTAYLDVPSRTV